MRRVTFSRFIFPLFALLLAGGTTWWVVIKPRVEARARWTSALPPLPNLTGKPEALRVRIEQADARLRTWPPNLNALAEIAMLYDANGFSQQAEAAFRTLHACDKSNPRWPHLLANVLADSGRIDEAVDNWREAIALQRDYLPSRLRLAEGLRKLNRREEAIVAYNKVLRRDPGNVYALLGLAVIDVEAERWAAAREKLLKTIGADNTLWGAFSLLASVADHLGDAVLANRAKQRAVALGGPRELPDPWNEEIAKYCFDVYRLRVAASARQGSGRATEAIPLLVRAAELAPQDAQTHRQLGGLYLQNNDLAAARQELTKAIELNTGEPNAYVDLVRVYRASNDVASAQKVLEDGLRVAPQSPALHYEYGLVLVALGRVDDAAAHLEKARDLAPENVGTYEKLAMADFRLNRIEAALAAIHGGLEKDPHNGPLLILLGRYEIQRGNAGAAEKLLGEAKNVGAPEATVRDFAQIFEARFGRAPN